MSYNLVDPTTGDLTRVAGNSNIVDSAIGINSTWSSKKISADLANKQDFRIFNSLEEFNEKKGTSLTVVSGIDNMKDIVNAMSNGEILIIIVRYELSSDVYFGLTTDTGWTKMFTFIKSNGLCDVECRTTYPLTIKRVLNSDGVVGDWQVLATADKLGELPLYSGNLNDLHPNGFSKYKATYSDLTNAPTVSYTPQMCYIDVWSDTANIYQMIRIVGVTYNPIADYSNTYIRSSHYTGSEYVWSSWVDIITSNNIGKQSVACANKIEPNYTSVGITTVTTPTTKYIHLADCSWQQTGTLQVHLRGDSFVDTLVINFGGGSGAEPMLCGHYSGNSRKVFSVIAKKGSDWNSDYSIYVKIEQMTTLTVSAALLTGDCTINITESTTAPTNISEWRVDYGLFGNITAPNITSLEQRVTALESKL